MFSREGRVRSGERLTLITGVSLAARFAAVTAADLFLAFPVHRFFLVPDPYFAAAYRAGVTIQCR